MIETPADATQDLRSHPPFMAGDRESLESWLELYRTTLPLKIDGLTPEQLSARSVPPSTLSLLGIVRHLTGVEQYWFTVVVGGNETPPIYCEDDDDGDFDDARAETASADVARYGAELNTARERAGEVVDLDAALPGRRRGSEVNLRWVYVHMIEEYARHLGHADLLREAVDGVTGY
ncbi:DinB family protein [Sanguibacter antarcticus]|uniref:Uncharacterized protein DUF664 n=1 Tax=Sanguibacter antarcticus TaxID=372484 RepID=A0A2A9E7V7_9MICO|nr:DinB family protein [Sanguibacter antarcticus]PFG34385.1 uncharacterized protein DUF664 [Sanguibacter antarcticus]